MPDHKDTVVCEEYWPADYPKIIMEKNDQKIPPSVFSLCKDRNARNITMALSVDEVQAKIWDIFY